jgi:hypothetical protein
MGCRPRKTWLIHCSRMSTLGPALTPVSDIGKQEFYRPGSIGSIEKMASRSNGTKCADGLSQSHEKRIRFDQGKTTARPSKRDQSGYKPMVRKVRDKSSFHTTSEISNYKREEKHIGRDLSTSHRPRSRASTQQASPCTPPSPPQDGQVVACRSLERNPSYNAPEGHS